VTTVLYCGGRRGMIKSGISALDKEPVHMGTTILLIYTGGTIGMMADQQHAGVLKNVDFARIEREIPGLRNLGCRLEVRTFDPVIDSSNITPENWAELALMIRDAYDSYDGFVILHGTDTMAYTASALSFMLENLAKPVILTGSQIPIGVLRTDGKENLITAVEIAAARRDTVPLVPEVCVYFESALLRGNRTTKYSVEQLHAFESPNCPPLASAGIDITYNHSVIRPPARKQLEIHTGLNRHIALITLHPGMDTSVLTAVLAAEKLKGVVLRTYGAGNAPMDETFRQLIAEAVSRGIIFLNITQCSRGSVNMRLYETGTFLDSLGVVSGHDMTTEAAVAKMMHLLAADIPDSRKKTLLQRSLRGELSEEPSASCPD
jgi:L-asparaginase